ncbi:hypothetical protein BH23GEM7_BH23GEM7_14140 [soil metagenome]|nr:nucleotidyltransferase domain-containing protein [Gemmatimonadota bacterium]
MNAADRAILEQFAGRVREIEPLARIWAFGSRARGDAAPDSDFDICVVVPAGVAELRRAVRKLAWEVGFEHERVLATIVLPEEEFEHGAMSASTLVANIRAEGVAA